MSLLPLSLSRLAPWSVLAVLTLADAQAQAQAQARAAQLAAGDALPGPLDPAAAVPPTLYRSTFDGPRSDRTGPPLTWQHANRLVEQIGGWRAYAREAAERPGATPVGSSTAPAGSADGKPATAAADASAAPVPAPAGVGGSAHGTHEAHGATTTPPSRPAAPSTEQVSPAPRPGSSR